MKVNRNLNRLSLGMTVLACWLAPQFAPAPSLSASKVACPAIAHTSRIDSSSYQPNLTKERSAALYGNLPLSFEANYSQVDSQVKFMSRGCGYNLYLTSKEAVMEFRAIKSPSPESPKRGPADSDAQSSVVRMKLVGANADARIIGLDELPGKSNYFIGNDPKKWRTNTPTYSRVKYESIYPGVDLVFYGNQQQLEYDLIVAPGADPKAIRFVFDGAERIRVDARGDLVLRTSAGDLRQHKPNIYQQSGVKREVAGGFAIKNNREVGFDLGCYDQDAPLVIDPVLSYSTFLGGHSSDEGIGIAVDSAGSAYVVGRTLSFNFPTTSGAVQPSYSGGLFHAFVCKLNTAGTAIDYSTYLGGGKNSGDVGDQGLAIAIDSTGNAYVTGVTSSDDFPATAGVLQPRKAGPASAFVSRLDPSGSKLVYSTYLGGGHTIFGRFGRDLATGIAVDFLGNVYVAGYTSSIDFPTTNALQSAYAGGANDAFVAKLNPTGTELVYSTYFGGAGDDRATGIAVDSSRSAYVTGITSSIDLRTTPGAFEPQAPGGASDGFVLKLDASGSALIYCTYLGGSGVDQAAGIAVDSSGNAYVTGSTSSTDFPTANSFQPANHSGPVFKSTDGGLSWKAVNAGLIAGTVNAQAVDPKSSSTIYAGTDGGVFKSTDAGTTWQAVNNGLTKLDVRALAIDPRDSLTVYAGLFGAGVLKTTDGGSSWSSTSLPLSRVTALAISPALPSTIYAGGVGFPGIPNGGPPPVSGLFKSTDGGSSWLSFNLPDFFYFTVVGLAIDPTHSLTVYASTTYSFFKTTDGGATWAEMNNGLPKNAFAGALALDPINSSVLYLNVSTFDADKGVSSALFKTTDAASNWLPTMLANAARVIIDPRNSSIVYGITGTGVFKSIDGGNSWKVINTMLNSAVVNNAVIDPANTLTLYAGGTTGLDAFVTKLNAPGSALVYSTYFGGTASDSGSAIAVDAKGNVYVTGETGSEDFPVANAFQQTISRGEFVGDAFVIKLSSTGATLGYSTYLGGAGSDGGSGIAVDSIGNAYVTGFTVSDDFPRANAFQKKHGGGNLDAFVAKFSLPIIMSVELSRRKLIVRGQGFDTGAVILVDGEAQKTQNDESSPTSVLIANKAGRIIAPGHRVSIKVRNSDGSLSEPFSFTRSP